jgi:hypothetical protein
MRSVLFIIIFCALAVGQPGPGPRHPRPGHGPPTRLTKADREFLDGLLRDFLFDPREATRVRVRFPVRMSWSETFAATTRERDGWLVLGAGDRSPRVYFTDRQFIPAPSGADLRVISFETACRLEYAGRGDSPPMFEGPDDSDLARAAWLYRLGHERLAARALAAAREGSEDPREDLRRQLARRAAEELHDAFCTRADLEALGHGARLFGLYADLAPDFRHADEIMTDLVRRWWSGTLGSVPPAGWPPWFALWEPRYKVAWLVGSLDQVDEGPTPSRSQRWGEHPYLSALVALDEAAVPALLDVVENDRRLTRRPERYRGEPSGRVFTVREQAETAVSNILRVTQFEPTGPRARGPVGPRMRRYWEAYGRLPFDERMMAVLTDPQAQSRACLEAAENLAGSSSNVRVRWDRYDTGPAHAANPAVRKFQRPTAAHAILAALDGGRSGFDGTDRRGGRFDRGRTEERYVRSLVTLGDPSTAWELARRAGITDDPARRRLFALAAHQLGASGAWLALARDLERGSLPIARSPGGEFDPEIADGELEEFVRALIEHPLPDADRVLFALAAPDHPWGDMVARSVLTGDSVFDRHPVCLAVLRRALDDSTLTGRDYYLRSDEIELTGPDRKPVRTKLPPSKPEPSGWVEHAAERERDGAAERLAGLVAGAPRYHPLHRDADRILADVRAILDRYQFRRMTRAEAWRFGFHSRETGFVPDIPPLRRPATADDVAAGLAVFHLDGKGSAAHVTLPTWVALKGRSFTEGLVVQAEVGPDGHVVYGAIFRHGIRAVRADEVERIDTR